jgi:hypothetical protein
MWQQRPHPPAEFERPFSHAIEFWREFKEISKITTKTARVQHTGRIPMRGRGGQKWQHMFCKFRIMLVDLSFGNSAKMGRCKLLHPRQVQKRRQGQGTQREKQKMNTSGAKFNRVWRRKCSFGTGMTHFWNRKGQKKHPEKNCQAFPLVLRVKNQRIAAGKQPKKLTSVSPLQGF